jgi:MFS family permease
MSERLYLWTPLLASYLFANKGGSLADQKGYIASMIDLGSLIGGTIVGFLADRYDRRATFMMPLLFFSSLVMFLVAFALGSTVWTYYAVMFLIDNCIGGPFNIIGTVIGIDIVAQIQ